MVNPVEAEVNIVASKLVREVVKALVESLVKESAKRWRHHK